LQASVEAARG
jgi:BMFP domain-containing protein YqiC